MSRPKNLSFNYQQKTSDLSELNICKNISLSHFFASVKTKEGTENSISFRIKNPCSGYIKIQNEMEIARIIPFSSIH